VPIYDVYGNHVAFSGRKIEHYSKDVKNFYQLRNGKLEGFQKFFKWKTSKWINSPYKKSDHLYNLNLAKRYIFDSGFCFIAERSIPLTLVEATPQAPFTKALIVTVF
jgi:hypothetical protein